jgi:hypothetical protein
VCVEEFGDYILRSKGAVPGKLALRLDKAFRFVIIARGLTFFGDLDLEENPICCLELL